MCLKSTDFLFRKLIFCEYEVRRHVTVCEAGFLCAFSVMAESGQRATSGDGRTNAEEGESSQQYLVNALEQGDEKVSFIPGRSNGSTGTGR